MDRIRKYFINVKGKFDGIGYGEAYVPTKEEYDDFRERVSKCIDGLNKRIDTLNDKIEILEKEKEKKTPNKECKITVDDSLNNAYYRYLFLSRNAYLQYELYNYLEGLAKDNPKTLLEMWNKVLTKGQLKCPDDINIEFYSKFRKGNVFRVFDDNYVVSKTVMDGTVYFEPMKEEK